MMSFDRFLARETFAVAALNAGMNAAYMSWQWAGHEALSLGGPGGIAADLAMTPVFIAVLSTLLGTAGARRKLAAGMVGRPSRLPVAAILSVLPRGIVMRSFALGIAAALVCAIPLHAALGATGIDTLSLGQSVVAKVVITLVFSLLILPIGLLAAASDAMRSRPLALA